MKIESAKVTWQMGSSSGAETGPLFPPLHVSEMGAKSSIRAPPRNKMALFEQFTVPFNRNAPSHEAGLRNPSPKQHGANESHFDHLSYAVPATLASTNTIDCAVGTNIKSSYSSSFGSLSTCSAIFNMDVSQRVQMVEPAEDTSPSCRVTHERFRSINIMKHSAQEVTNRCDGLASAGSQLSGPEMGESENNMNTDVLNHLHNEGSNQPKSSALCVERHPSLRSTADPRQKPVVVSQDDSPCIAGVVHVKTTIANASSCEKVKPEIVIPSSTSIKPKHLMDAVGQRLFWKARKAILRQQEIFSNQVFELHKLIKVQKLLAKMSGPLIDEYVLLGGVPDKLGCDHLPAEGGSSELENLGDRRAKAPAPQKCVSQQAWKKQQQNFVQCEESEIEKTMGGVAPDASFPRVMTNAPFGEPCRSVSTEGVSAWGYPMGPLNRPVIYPSGSGSLPSGSPFNGAYVVGPAPSMAPFAFPCYGQRPEPWSAACPNNQWPSAMYYNPFLTPVVNDWFAMNYQGRASLASGSEKAAPTSSVPSINMTADVSMHSVQPAAFPCVRPQLGSSRLIATRSLGSHHATASVSTPPNAILKRPGAGKAREQSGGPSRGSGSGCVASEGGGAYEGEKVVAAAEAHGWLRNVAGEQLPMSYGQRADRMNVDSFLGGNALNLFPLQPSSSSGGYSEGGISRQADCQGRVIKAVPRSALAASESAVGILLSIQRERQL